jgi:signal transduction histidine kinase
MNPCNVLAVDDEIENLNAIERVLSRDSEFKIIKAVDPESALKIIQNESVHMILTDQRMPGMTGIDLLNRSMEYAPDAIRMIVTAYTETKEILDAINLGHVYGYITKPWKPEELRSTLYQAKRYCSLVTQNRSLTDELTLKNEILEQQNEELRQFSDLKNRFMVVASHELRTPATIITGSLELLMSQSENLNVSQKKILQNALNGTFRLNEIIQTFFETIRIKAGETILHPSVVDLKRLVDLVVDRFTPYMMERKLKFSNTMDKKLRVMADQRKLYMVFENLLSNSIKYTPDGGNIECAGYVEDSQVKIEVKDSGIGIPRVELTKIFDTFYQLQNINYHHTSRYEFMGGGTGLGLSLCKSIIEAHQGKIWAESEGDGKGSTFFLTLPLYDKSYDLMPKD